MSVTVRLKIWRPTSGLLRRVLPGMTSFHLLFQTDRPMRRLLVKPGALPKTAPDGAAQNAWCSLL